MDSRGVVAAEGRYVTTEGRDDTYSETLGRVAAQLDAEKVDHVLIESMSQESAREFLNEVIVKIAASLGITAAKVAALVADIMEMARSAGKAFSDAYRSSYERARRIKPYED